MDRDRSSSGEEDAPTVDIDQSQHQAILNQQHAEEEINVKFPNKPTNEKDTLPFHTLYQDLFEPLIANQNRKTKTRPTGRQAGPHGGPSGNPVEIRRGIIERYISRWRREVGNDFYPAMRLIIPEKDRDRAMYGLKEKAIARYLVKLMKIDKNSEDGFNLLNWKLPGQNAAARNAGDFAGRCQEVLSKRAHRIEPGNMTIGEVNKQLDELSKESNEDHQLPIMELFYKNMNADEMTWLIRIIIRAMRIGATERTILNVWHPDADALFNVSSSLKRVCWDLFDPKIRLESDKTSVKLGETFLPQLAHQPNMSFAQMVASMKPTEEDPEFWIEEKLDGERMQLHVWTEPDKEKENESKKHFKFWSRHAKDYSYLYGDSFDNPNSALTQYIKDGFKDGVENAILDGEMITWNSEQDVIVPFGTLKTAAITQQTNSQHYERPFYRIFDILLLNDQTLTRYTLRDRRKALEATINNVHRRMEILEYSVGTCVEDIENRLRDVVTRASEGLVLKNPRSAYTLNARLFDWVKVKPEYMTEFGESLDCLIIGGYYGSGRRGGDLSSFLCGLREEDVNGKKSSRFQSFFKVGGGMTTDDFKKLRHNTEGKWLRYDPSRPPTDYILLGGGSRQIERPDMWIKPQDSIVVEVKAASVNASEDYATGTTLRFPRFTKFRLDKNWETALSLEDFQNVKIQAEIKAEENKKEAKMQMNQRKQKTQTARKKQVLIAGYEAKDLRLAKFDSVKSNVFQDKTFYIMTECTKPTKKSKIELEQMVKENGGTIVQTPEIKQKDSNKSQVEVICIAERKTVKVASLEKRNQKDIIKPIWLFDCIEQAKIDFARGMTEITLPFELDRHLFYCLSDRRTVYEGNVDDHGDSYARDTTEEELRTLVESMDNFEDTVELAARRKEIEKHDLLDYGNCRGWMFEDLRLWFDEPARAVDKDGDVDMYETEEEARVAAAKITARFAGTSLAASLDDKNVTHVVLCNESDKKSIRRTIAQRKKLPRVVRLDWVEECWKERTRIDEERYAVI